MAVKSIKQANIIVGQKVLWRADFNVPIKNGKIVDDYKIIKHLPTLEYLLEKKCKIIIITHLGRPHPGHYDENFSVKPIAKKLEKLVNKKIKVVKHITGFKICAHAEVMKQGEILMLENIRFSKEEKLNSKKLAKELASLASIYVNDAFAVSHRAHMSVSAIKKYLPSYAGFLLEKEIVNLNKIITPKKPLVVVMGGVKAATKAPLIKKLHKKAQRILIGGALANNFLKAHNYEVGKSVIDKESVEIAKKFKDKNIILPVDVIVSSGKESDDIKIKDIRSVSKEEYIFDIGPKTIKLFSSHIKQAQTIVWNGPMGLFEFKNFKQGTLAIARIVASRSTGHAFGVVGGGETVEALKITKMIDYLNWVSTGGGAMLSYLGGEKMPGLKGII